MSLTYRFEIKLEGILEGRHGELREFLLSLYPRTGKNKWNETFKAVEKGEHQIIYRSNNKGEVFTQAGNIARRGGLVNINDLAPEMDDPYGPN